MDFTLIDGHTAARKGEPFYQRSQCENWSLNFFSISNSGFLTIEDSELDNIRVRAERFIRLEGSSHLAITNTAITNMDFAGGFIGGESEEVVLQGLVVSGFNRDHAYSSKYFTSDSGLFRFTWVTSFTFTDSVCEDNIMFAGRRFYIIESKKAFFSLANFAVATLRNNTFRRSMHSFGFFSENESVLVIENCTFEGDFAVGRSYIELGTDGRINTRIEESLFQGITSSFGPTVLMQVQGELRISRTQFIDIYVFIPAGGFWYSAPLAMLYLTYAANITLDHILARSVQIGGLRTVPLIENLLATGLLNNCQAVQEDYMQAMELPCAALFHIATWTDVQVSNVDLTESGLCNSAIQIIGALGANETLIVDQLNVNTSANYGIIAGKLLPDPSLSQCKIASFRAAA